MGRDRKIGLSLEDRLETAAQLVLRARIFYDLWWFLVGQDTRPKITDILNKYSEFFLFTPHAYELAFVVQISALFESRSDTINLPILLDEVRNEGRIAATELSKADALLALAMPMAQKEIILRSNLFAHRSSKLSYSEAYSKASVIPNRRRELTEHALGIANMISVGRGGKEHWFNKYAIQDVQALVGDLVTNTCDLGTK